MPTAKLKSAIDCAMRLSCWQAPENPRVLEGGIINVNLLIADQGQDYVVRMSWMWQLFACLVLSALSRFMTRKWNGLKVRINDPGHQCLGLAWQGFPSRSYQ